MNLLISTKDLSTILLTVVFIGTFLSIFFFTYASKIEEQIVIKQMDYITNELLDNFDIVVTDDLRKNIKIQLEKVKSIDLQSEDNEASENNKKIFSNTIKIIVPILLIVLLLTFGLSFVYNFSFKDILKQSIFILLVIAITEILFLNIFAKHYISADLNFVKYKIVSDLEHDVYP